MHSNGLSSATMASPSTRMTGSSLCCRQKPVIGDDVIIRDVWTDSWSVLVHDVEVIGNVPFHHVRSPVAYEILGSQPIICHHRCTHGLPSPFVSLSSAIWTA